MSFDAVPNVIALRVVLRESDRCHTGKLGTKHCAFVIRKVVPRGLAQHNVGAVLRELAEGFFVAPGYQSSRGSCGEGKALCTTESGGVGEAAAEEGNGKAPPCSDTSSIQACANLCADTVTCVAFEFSGQTSYCQTLSSCEGSKQDEKDKAADTWLYRKQSKTSSGRQAWAAALTEGRHGTGTSERPRYFHARRLTVFAGYTAVVGTATHHEQYSVARLYPAGDYVFPANERVANNVIIVKKAGLDCIDYGRAGSGAGSSPDHDKAVVPVRAASPQMCQEICAGTDGCNSFRWSQPGLEYNRRVLLSVTPADSASYGPGPVVGVFGAGVGSRYRRVGGEKDIDFKAAFQNSDTSRGTLFFGQSATPSTGQKFFLRVPAHLNPRLMESADPATQEESAEMRRHGLNYGDRVVLSTNEHNHKTSNCGWYGCRTSVKPRVRQLLGPPEKPCHGGLDPVCSPCHG